MKNTWFACYRLLTLLAFPFLLVWAAIHILIRPGRLGPYLERFALVLPGAVPESRKRVWIHGVSVGEVISCGPIIELFEKNGFLVYLSVSTPCGFSAAQQRYFNVHLFYFPFDYSFLGKRVLRRIKPLAVLLCEVEIWPAFVQTVKEHKVPLYLISGRLSRRDYRNYRLIRFFFRHVLSLFDGLFLQTDLDAKRMKALCNHKNLKNLGSLKFDVASDHPDQEITNLLPEGFLICAASTHRGEEDAILSAFKSLRCKYPDLKLAVAPRQLHRVKEVIGILERLDLKFTLRSSNQKCSTPVFVVDSMGELGAVFPHCELVVMGGSFSKRVGGHNLIEPSRHGRCVLCGPQMGNFEGIFLMYEKEQALILTSLQNLSHDLERLVADKASIHLVGENALRLIQQQRGAAQRIYGEIMQGVVQEGDAG